MKTFVQRFRNAGIHVLHLRPNGANMCSVNKCIASDVCTALVCHNIKVFKLES